ncbi:MAG: histidine phosphatase family protein, partial [Flavobacteriaceae bacterium]
MKTLIFLRHAKSSWELNVDDRNRPLSENGMDRIKKIAKRSSLVFENADKFFTRPSNRAFHTPSIMMHKIKIPFTK